ncbi:hypothetical protein CFIMG_004397RA [Ceratocystis fimbriata CBS 114723]|uniref:Uncharacterized protein n=1 Tax=Ceratocystis fimbriata CBS 114723 TaxID=1035309 RepID=A0A2C5WY14_9PEZI|nr:hypothetical protein CFIMG_004397RA [Ceratocystis fimbriata CBS 114723]
MAASAQLSMSRLERLFSRRRVSPSHPQQHQLQHTSYSSAHNALPSPAASEDDEPLLFPSPSFIKPTASRMVARDEVTLQKSPSRLNLTLSTQNLKRPGSSHVVSPARKVPNSRNSNFSASSRSTISSTISASPSTSTSPSTVCSADYNAEYPTSSISSRRSHCVIPTLTFQLSPGNDYPSPIETPPMSPGLGLEPPLSAGLGCFDPPRSPGLNFEPRPSFCSEMSINSYFEGGKLENFPHPPRPITPPSSEAEDCVRTPSVASPQRAPPTRLVARGPAPDFSSFQFPPKAAGAPLPTPSQSPKMPVKGSRAALAPINVATRNNRIAVSNPEMRDAFNSLRRSSSVSGAEIYQKAPMSPIRPKTSASADGILREPTVNDFMDLNDEDIAEEEAQLQQRKRSLVPSKSTNRLDLETKARARAFTHTKNKAVSETAASESMPASDSNLLTLSPPMSSQPATLAAFQAARIATRYDFNLVYVVNLWPNSADPMATPTCSSVRNSQLSVAESSQNRLTGRLLAAYGLECVQSPFRISSVVHSKILQAEDWIEYRCPEIHDDEFSQGYACSFYTGQYGRRKSETDVTPASARDASCRRNIDRGIVFAAYRKPTPGKARRAYSKSDLEQLRHEAEALVEMLMDIHFTSSLQSASLFAKHFEETGPMPAHTPPMHS